MDRKKLPKLKDFTDDELGEALTSRGVPDFISELKISREWLYTRLRCSGYRKENPVYRVGLQYK